MQQGQDSDRPNVVFVLLDDVGFADFGCYGSEIRTANIDRLAAGGLRYNNFHTTTLCSPTRACLLTGRNHHSVGMRFLANVDSGVPSGRGTVTHRAANLAEIVRQAGVATFCVGKWHLAPMDHTSAAGPFDQWPLSRGFDRFYGFMDGGTDHFYPDLVYDNHRIEPPRTPEEGYHLTEDLVDHAIEFLADHLSHTPERPFFLYLALGAAHFPHQAPADFLEACRGAYDRGWDAVRAERFERQKQLGIVPAETVLPPSNPGVTAWDELDADARTVACRLQEAYAAFMEHTDVQLGRLFDQLALFGKQDDTLIVLLSDNGASPEGGPNGMVEMIRLFNGLPTTTAENLARIDEIGGPRSFADYPWGWAQASNTPLRWYKHNTHGGGVRDPLIVSWPDRIQDGGAIRTQFHHVTDLTPTVLEILDLEAPEIHRGLSQLPIHGTSLAYTFSEADAPTRKPVQYFEMEGHRGIWHDGWKAVTYHQRGTSYEDDVWELYHLDADFSESRNLADAEPARLQECIRRWWVEAGAYDVLPLDDRGAILYGLPPRPGSVLDRDRFVYYPGTAHVPPQAAPPTQDVSYTLAVDLVRPALLCDGILVSYGSAHSGYVLYVQEGRLVHTYNYCGEEHTVASIRELPLGRVRVAYEFQKTGPLQGVGRLRIGEEIVVELALSRTLSRISLETLRVGRGGGLPVSAAIVGPFPFAGQIERVEVVIGDDRDGPAVLPDRD